MVIYALGLSRWIPQWPGSAQSVLCPSLAQTQFMEAVV